VFRRETFETEEDYAAEIVSLSPLHLLGLPGSRPTESGSKYPPTFIMHGTNDPGVPMHHALRYVSRLRELGRPVGWHFANKGHAFDIWIAPGNPLWYIVHEGVEFVDKHVREKKQNGPNGAVAKL
jgi:acetyl esterase/lipase